MSASNMDYEYLKDLLVVPEEIVKHCSDQVTEQYPGDTNNFKLCLDIGEKFKVAGLTPLYLCKETMKDIYVTSVEKFQKKFH